MTTGFRSEYGGSSLDLDQIFDFTQPGVTPRTGFIAGYDGAGQDLSDLLTARDKGDSIGYNTGFVALDGRDLADWFCKSGTAFIDIPIGAGIVVTSTFDLVNNGALPMGAARAGGLWRQVAGTVFLSSNEMADVPVPCPGTYRGTASANAYNGFAPTTRYRIPPNSTWQLYWEVANLAPVSFNATANSVGAFDFGFVIPNTGDIAWCNSGGQYYEDALFCPNGFAPAVGTLYSSIRASGNNGGGGNLYPEPSLAVSFGAIRSPSTNFPSCTLYIYRTA